MSTGISVIKTSHAGWLRRDEPTIEGGALTEETFNTVISVQQLRQKAELLRRVASIPTHGDRLIDWDLLVLADHLEEEADVREEYLKPAACQRMVPR